MDRLNKIIVKKFFSNSEPIKPSNLLTDEEYQIVKNCQLDDLLKSETHPAALDRICEGEKVQTAEYYQQKEKKFKRDFAKLYRKTGKDSRPPRTVAQVVPSHDDQTAPDVNPPSTKGANQPSVPFIATEEAMEPTRSNESNVAPNDPYQLREEIPIVMPLAVLPEDDNFGSNDVDGARDFLQLCTGEELPPMSMRQTMTREMVLSQLPSIPLVPPPVDNFQELDLKTINTPMFKRPLKTSTPFGAGQDAQILLPDVPEFIAEEIVGGPIEDRTVGVPPNTAIETVPATAQPGPSAENSGPPSSSMSARPAVVETSSSSTDLSDTPAPRRRRTPQEISFTERLEPFEKKTASMPRARRNFDIFSFPCHAIWNKAIQDVQNQLSESYKQLQLAEKTVMREAAPEQRIDSGFQQTPDVLAHRPATMSATETSNLVTINQMGDKEPNVGSIQQDTLMTPDLVASMLPNELDPLSSIDGKLTEVSDRFPLPSFAEGTSTRHEKIATEQLAPVETVSVLKESSKGNVAEPVVEPDSRTKKNPKRGNRIKKTKPVQNENDPVADVSSVLFSQAKELDTVSANIEIAEEIAPINTMVVDILLAVQGAMNSEEELGHPLPMQRLRQLLRINSCLEDSKLFKNIILLKQADLLSVECNAGNQIINVSLELPQVDDDDVP